MPRTVPTLSLQAPFHGIPVPWAERERPALRSQGAVPLGISRTMQFRCAVSLLSLKLEQCPA